MQSREDISLVPVSTPEQVEWLRVQRSRPELYKYFRQDRPISINEQRIWWNGLNKTRVKLYLIHDGDERVGYVGFNPFSLGAKNAEFGIFIIPEFQRKGYATRAMLKLLEIGFDQYNLSYIYSDVLDYEGENRFDFYEAMGFIAYPKEHQTRGYLKNRHWIPSIRFFMNKDMWLERRAKQENGQDGDARLEPFDPPTAAKKRGRPKKERARSGVHTG